MKCKDVERLILDMSEGEENKYKIEEIKHHISHCSKCATLEDDLKNIRDYLLKMPFPIPAEEFFEKTRALCNSEIGKISLPEKRLIRPPIPKYIWAAFSTLLILTGVLMLPLGIEISVEEPLSFQTIGVLIILVRNLVMLFFAPVLIHKIRFRKKDFVNGFMPTGSSQA